MLTKELTDKLFVELVTRFYERRFDVDPGREAQLALGLEIGIEVGKEAIERGEVSTEEGDRELKQFLTRVLMAETQQIRGSNDENVKWPSARLPQAQIWIHGRIRPVLSISTIPRYHGGPLFIEDAYGIMKAGLVHRGQLITRKGEPEVYRIISVDPINQMLKLECTTNGEQNEVKFSTDLFRHLPLVTKEVEGDD